MTEKFAETPLNFTAVAPVNVVPVIVMLVPTRPRVGVKLVIVGATRKLVALVAVPPAVLARTALLKPYLAISRAYAERLGMKKGAKR